MHALLPPVLTILYKSQKEPPISQSHNPTARAIIYGFVLLGRSSFIVFAEVFFPAQP